MTDEQEIKVVDDLIANGQRAMEQISQATQAEIDELVTAIAWALYKPDNARAMAELAVKDTGLSLIHI